MNGRRDSLRRVAVPILIGIGGVAALLTAGLLDRETRGSGSIEVVPAAAPDRTAVRPPAVEAPAGRAATTLEQAIRQAAHEPDIVLRDLRLVDTRHGIACGERSGGDARGFRRFVWIGETRTLVTDDGGADFALLANVCDPRRAPTG